MKNRRNLLSPKGSTQTRPRRTGTDPGYDRSPTLPTSGVDVVYLTRHFSLEVSFGPTEVVPPSCCLRVLSPVRGTYFLSPKICLSVFLLLKVWDLSNFDYLILNDTHLHFGIQL